MKQYIYNMLVNLSQLLCCTIYFQNPDKSFSQLCGEMKIKGEKEPNILQCIIFIYHPAFINICRQGLNFFFFVVFGELNHCEDAYLTSAEKNTKDIFKFSKE